MSTRSDPVNYHHTFAEADPEHCRAWCLNVGDLVLYDPDIETAWLSCQDAPLTREYR